jgi:hypothetical protein
MVPSITTLETATRARMEDRTYEAEQYRQARLARQGSANDRQALTVSISPFVRLRQLAAHVIGAAG